MINSLKKMLKDKFCNSETVNTTTSTEDILEENYKLKKENDKLRTQLNVALDEIVQNQARINAILKQLKNYQN